ncbi:MAG: hypothetical protein JNM80_05635 [Phycisphaerae bacterium]|nr:hypothetical protein [Phycisphaerae bacterium]
MPHFGVRASAATRDEYRRVRILARAVRPKARVDALLRDGLRHFAKVLRREGIRNGLDMDEVELEAYRSVPLLPRMRFLPRPEGNRIKDVRPS